MAELVFLSGSLSIPSLPEEVTGWLDRLAAGQAEFCVGDAPGADRLFQNLLYMRRFERVEVFHSGPLRNNLGNWPTHYIEPNIKSLGKEAHAYKDREMCKRASMGLVVWDGRSAGTLSNVLDLISQAKAAYLFSGSGYIGTFSNLQQVEEFCSLNAASTAALEEAKRRILRFQKREKLRRTASEDTLF